jgi:L-fuculose-phosphate aldolase
VTATEEVRAGELAGFSRAAQLALLARSLHREGFDDQIWGHITWQQEDGTLLINPVHLAWNEVRASDVLTLSPTGEKIAGVGDATPAITLHVELHRRRADATIIVHHHPQWSTVFACAGRVPPVYEQMGAQVADRDIVMIDEYEGGAHETASAVSVHDRLGGARVAFLGHHGLLVIADDVVTAHHRAVTVERRCRTAWRVAQLGGGVEMPQHGIQGVLEARQALGGFPELWHWAARREIEHDPRVLD